MEISVKISDEKLLRLCEQYGSRALVWRRKFIGLLPEVNRRRLYERRGCQSIFEFAAKFGGLSKEQVQRALQLDHQFVDKPTLHTLLTQGQTSVSKLAKVASIATLENEAELATQVQRLPRAALETLARDERLSKEQDGSMKPSFEAKVVPGNNFELSAEVVEELSHLHEQGQDVNAILLDLLQQRRQKIAQKKQQLAEQAKPTDSRYISIPTRNVLHEEFGTKCSIPTCSHPAEEIHHTQRFALAKTHDPHYLAPLCHEHHQIAHSIDQRVQAHWSG